MISKTSNLKQQAKDPDDDNVTRTEFSNDTKVSIKIE